MEVVVVEGVLGIGGIEALGEICECRFEPIVDFCVCRWRQIRVGGWG